MEASNEDHDAHDDEGWIEIKTATSMILPLKCSAEYIPDFLSDLEAQELYSTLIDQYKIDKAQLIIEAGGQKVATNTYKILFATERLIAQNSHPASIHGKSFIWTGLMTKLRDRIEEVTGKEFELAMCLYYPNGNYYAAYHNDHQTSGLDTIIPSLSLGEVREFSFKENGSDKTYSLDLANGSLLLMGQNCQDRYTHSLPKNTKYKKGRINITFREPDFK